MPREALIAIVIGFLFGLIITFGVYTANRSLKEKEVTVEAPSPTTLPSPESSPQPLLVIDSPENESLVSEEKLVLRGHTSPEAIIAVFTEENEHLLTASREGTFSAEIKLVKGVNYIKVMAVDKQNQKTEEDLIIVYSTAKIE